MKIQTIINRHTSVKRYSIKNIPVGVLFYHQHNLDSHEFPKALNFYIRFLNNIICFHEEGRISLNEIGDENIEEWIIAEDSKITLQVNLPY